MSANPVLVEMIRGAMVENRHRAAFVVADAAGRVIASAGDPSVPVFPRSAVKSMQALALFTTGAAHRFGLADEEIAIAAASHHGEDIHVRRVEGFLERLGLSAADLECGAHQPSNAGARNALRSAGEKPTPLHNNCSGKHAGMLADAVALGVETAGYVGREHPVQVAVRAAIEAAIGDTLSIDIVATDGCSIPTWAAPLTTFARGFARMATGQGLSDDLAAASRRIFDAATRHPDLVAGTGQFDTVVMDAFGGCVMQKGGAEGVQCGAIRDRGWGYAIKCDDGNMAASQVMAAELLAALAAPNEAQLEALQPLRRLPVRNVRNLLVGEVRPTEALRQALKAA